MIQFWIWKLYSSQLALLMMKIPSLSPLEQYWPSILVIFVNIFLYQTKPISTKTRSVIDQSSPNHQLLYLLLCWSQLVETEFSSLDCRVVYLLLCWWFGDDWSIKERVLVETKLLITTSSDQQTTSCDQTQLKVVEVKPLQKVQNLVLRAIMSACRTASINGLHKILRMEYCRFNVKFG